MYTPRPLLSADVLILLGHKGPLFISEGFLIVLKCHVLLSCFRHSPFRQQKTKDKHEIDRMTMTMVSVGIKLLQLLIGCLVLLLDAEAGRRVVS